MKSTYRDNYSIPGNTAPAHVSNTAMVVSMALFFVALL